MYLIDAKSPYQDRFMRLRRKVYIEQGHIGIVFRDHKFAYFLSEGWNSPLNPWAEQLVAIIPIKFYFVKVELDILAGDGFCFQSAFNIKFTFDPSKASERQRLNAVSLVMGRNPDRVIRELVEREARYALRKESGYFTGEELLRGHVRTRIERSMRHHLQVVVQDLGINISPSSGVLIEEMIPPRELMQVQMGTYQREKMIEQLEKHPDTALQTYMLEALTKNNNVTFLNRVGTTSLWDDLYTSAFRSNGSGSQQNVDEETQNAVIINVPGEPNGYYRQEVRG